MRIAQDRRRCHRRNNNVNIITRSDARRRATYKSESDVVAHISKALRQALARVIPFRGSKLITGLQTLKTVYHGKQRIKRITVTAAERAQESPGHADGAVQPLHRFRRDAAVPSPGAGAQEGILREQHHGPGRQRCEPPGVLPDVADLCRHQGDGPGLPARQQPRLRLRDPLQQQEEDH